MIDIFIAGAQKAGTTSLARYLAQHPNIFTHEQMEMTHFFLEEEFILGDKNLSERYGFEMKKEGFLNLAKHATHTRSEVAIQRLHDYNPDCKVIFCVREPVERAFSSYLMEKKNKSFSYSFDEVVAIALEEKEKHWFYNVFIELGCYINHIQTLLKCHQRSNVMIVQLEELESRPNLVLNEIFMWLGYDKFEIKEFEKHNSRDKKSISRLTKKFKELPKFKNLIIKIIGRKRVENLLLKIIGSSVSEEESLDKYPKAVSVLSDYYKEHNANLSSNWGANYESNKYRTILDTTKKH